MPPAGWLARTWWSRAPAPARLIEGGIPTEATVAQVLVSKYADHLPLYRQAQIYARQGVNLDRSTLADWVGRAAFLLRPVHERLLAILKSSTKLFADETTAPVLDPGRGRTKTGQLFAYARDDRPWGGTDPPGVAYVYAPDRKAERPIAHLAGFVGVLQVDGYRGYRALADQRNDAVTLAFCWAHVRRRFYELAAAGPAPIASEALQRIASLYQVEAEVRGRSADERRTARQERSRHILNDFEPWLRAKLAIISQKTKLAEAIRYTLSRWNGLSCFVDDGRIEIDSNAVERTIRPIALNRKNALFAGSDGGAEHWAVIASLIETCKLNGVDPLAYLAASITKIVNAHPNARLDELLPWAYPPANQRIQGRGLKTTLTIHPSKRNVNVDLPQSHALSNAALCQDRLRSYAVRYASATHNLPSHNHSERRPRHLRQSFAPSRRADDQNAEQCFLRCSVI